MEEKGGNGDIYRRKYAKQNLPLSANFTSPRHARNIRTNPSPSRGYTKRENSSTCFSTFPKLGGFLEKNIGGVLIFPLRTVAYIAMTPALCCSAIASIQPQSQDLEYSRGLEAATGDTGIGVSGILAVGIRYPTVVQGFVPGIVLMWHHGRCIAPWLYRLTNSLVLILFLSIFYHCSVSTLILSLWCN